MFLLNISMFVLLRIPVRVWMVLNAIFWFKTFALQQNLKKYREADVGKCFGLMPDLVCCVQTCSGTMRLTIAPLWVRRRWSSKHRRVEGGGGRLMWRRRRRRVEEHFYWFLAWLFPVSILTLLLLSVPQARFWQFFDLSLVNFLFSSVLLHRHAIKACKAPQPLLGGWFAVYFSVQLFFLPLYGNLITSCSLPFYAPA